MMRLLAGLFCLWALPAAAVDCYDHTFDGTEFSICAVDPSQDDLRLFLNDAQGDPFGSWAAIENVIGPLSFAINGGMYHNDRRPVGYYVEDFDQSMFLVTNPGPGNFGLLPNGVFCFGDGQVQVIETLSFEASAPECRYATQSGPMLVIDGALHPRFISGGTSRHLRNGVGVKDGIAYFAISNSPVNFDTFGRLFRDFLNTPNALYFDGKVSRLYAPSIRRNDFGVRLGPIVGVVAPNGG
jgi:uncharacterized protein YigE (DUF2233 family)